MREKTVSINKTIHLCSDRDGRIVRQVSTTRTKIGKRLFDRDQLSSFRTLSNRVRYLQLFTGKLNPSESSSFVEIIR